MSDWCLWEAALELLIVILPMSVPCLIPFKVTSVDYSWPFLALLLSDCCICGHGFCWMHLAFHSLHWGVALLCFPISWVFFFKIRMTFCTLDMQCCFLVTFCQWFQSFPLAHRHQVGPQPCPSACESALHTWAFSYGLNSVIPILPAFTFFYLQPVVVVVAPLTGQLLGSLCWDPEW